MTPKSPATCSALGINDMVVYYCRLVRDDVSDVKRSQNLEAVTEARALRSRPRPRANFLGVEARPGRGQAEARDKVMNKKYQI